MKMNNPLLTKQVRFQIGYFLIFLLMLIVLISVKVSPPIFLVTAGTIATILFSWIIFKEYKMNPVRITPIIILFVLPLFMIGLSAIYQGIQYFEQDYAIIGPMYVSTRSTMMGYLMFSVSLFFQFLGIILLKPKVIVPIKIWDHKSNVKLLPQFFFFLFISKYTEINFTLGVIQTFLNFLPLSILVFIALRDRNNMASSYQYRRNSVIIGSVLLFLLSLVSLSKSAMLYAILPIPIFYLINGNKLKRYKAIAAGIFVLMSYLLFIQPFVGSARLATQTILREVNLNTVIDYILVGDYGSIYANDENNSTEVFLNRLFEINAPAFIYELTKSYGFKYGETFNKMVYVLIPRIVWQDKPIITQSNEFATEYFNQSKNNIGMLISGELYWNFGFIGIIVGSFILGLCMGYIWKMVSPLAFNNFIYFAIYFRLLQSCMGGSEFSALFSGLLQLFIIFVLMRLADRLFKLKVQPY